MSSHSKSELDRIQDALAAAFDGLLDISGPVSPIIPATLTAQSAYVAPAEDEWFSTIGESATFARPSVSYELVVIAPAYDWPLRQSWLQSQVPIVSEHARTTTDKVDGRTFPKMLTARIGVIDQAKGLLGVRCQFSPIQLRSA